MKYILIGFALGMIFLVVREKVRVSNISFPDREQLDKNFEDLYNTFN